MKAASVRATDVEVSKFGRLIEMLPAAASRDGLDLQSIDLTLMLLRSTLEEVRNYVVLRAAADDYLQYRTAALRYEDQKKLFQELRPA